MEYWVAERYGGSEEVKVLETVNLLQDDSYSQAEDRPLYEEQQP